MTTKRALTLLVLLHVALALAYNAVTPAATAAQHNPDENAHVQYVAQLASGHLPVFMDAQHGYESHQPPLYYAICLPVYAAARGMGDAAATKAVRVVSTVLGALLVIVTYLCIAAFLPEEKWLAFGTAAFVALLPMNVAQSASVTNDALTNLLLAVGLWLLTRLAMGGKVSSVWLGVILGAGIWTKTSTLLLFPTVAFAFFLLARQKVLDVKTAAKAAGVALCLGLTIGLPWLVRNQLLYGDPLARHIFEASFVGTTAQAGDIARGVFGGSLPDYLAGVARWTFASFWGVFDSMLVFWGNSPLAYPPGHWPSPKAPLPFIYNLLAMLCAMSLVGLISFFRARRMTATQGVVVVSFAVLTALTGLAHLLFVLTFFQAQGRYWFPALVPLAFFFMLGWRGLFPRPAHFRVIVCLLMAGLLALNIYTLAGLLAPRFGGT